MSNEPIRLASRGSDLALRQASEVKTTLADRRHDVEVVEVETKGDRVTDALISELGKTGAFVHALDQEVLEGNVDAAVHSMKDVPTEMADDLLVAAVPRRGNPADVLVTPNGATLDELPPGSVVGTASLRRGAQVQARRPDLTVEPVRGNVDTRVEKLLAPALQAEHEARTEAEKERKAGEGREQDRTDNESIRGGIQNLDRNRENGDDEEDGPRKNAEYDQPVEEWFESLTPLQQSAMGREVETEYDAVVLARIGLERTGLIHHVGVAELPKESHVPSAGQGALCITTHRDSDVADTLRDALDHVRSRVETTVERVVLEELGGGCIAPIGIYALLKGETVRTSVQVFSRDGTERVAETRDLDAENYAAEAREFAADLRGRGAAELIEAARREE